MTELDFLPDWFFVRRQRRRSYFALIWLAGCLVAVMGVWFYMTQSKISEAQADLTNLKAERATVNEHLLRIDKLRAIRDDLIRKSSIAANLHNRADSIHVVHRLVSLMPDEIFLLSVQLSTEVIRERQDLAAGPGTRVPRRRASEPQPTLAPTANERTRYVLRLTGLAPADVAVANFIARLSATDAFEDVRMGYAKDLTRDGHRARQFEVTCRLAEDWQADQPDDSRRAAADAPAPTPRRRSGQ